MAKTMKRMLISSLALLLGFGMMARSTAATELEEAVNFAPVVQVHTSADSDVYVEGEQITWTVTVKNVSNFTAYDVMIRDEMTSDIWMIGALYPGVQMVFHTVTETAAVGTIRNVVTVSWNDGDGIDDGEEPDEIRQTAAEEMVTVHAAAPAVPPASDKPAAGSQPTVVHSGEIEIPDEDVPLASVPKTGDVSALWIILIGGSACGLIRSGKKYDDEEG